jgi:Zinc-binding dehydrogenase
MMDAMMIDTEKSRRKKSFNRRSSLTRLRFRTGLSQRRLSFDASKPTVRMINAPIHCRAWLIKNCFIDSYWGIARPSLIITGKVHCDIKSRKPAHKYTRRMGFKTVAINLGNDKEALARKLGAHHYIDSVATDASAELQKRGGAPVILATAPTASAISPLVDGLSPDGVLLVPEPPAEPLMISVMPLIMERRSVAGWYSGTARDSQDTLEFSALSDVHPMIEKYPLERVAEGYAQMHSGKVRFRVVLTM